MTKLIITRRTNVLIIMVIMMISKVFNGKTVVIVIVE